MNSVLRKLVQIFIGVQLLVPFVYQFIESRLVDISDEAAAFWWFEGILMGVYYAPLIVMTILLYIFSESSKNSQKPNVERLLLLLAILVSTVGTAIFLLWWGWEQLS